MIPLKNQDVGLPIPSIPGLNFSSLSKIPAKTILEEFFKEYFKLYDTHFKKPEDAVELDGVAMKDIVGLFLRDPWYDTSREAASLEQSTIGLQRIICMLKYNYLLIK